MTNRSFVCLSLTACLLLVPAFTLAEKTTGRVAPLANRVADWQLANLERLEGIRTFREQSRLTRGWIQAAFYIGLERWSRVSGEPGHREALRTMAEANGWQLGDRFWHADDQAVAQVYLALEEPNSGPTQDVFDRVLELNPQNSLDFEKARNMDSEGGCQKRWCWCDALFMAPPAWAAMSRVSGDARYLDYAVREYRAVQDFLFDKEHKLFYRDSRFFERRTEHGNKVFWGRGNGWVFAGLPLLLEQLPQDHESRAHFVETYRSMANTFLAIQTDAGLWAPSLLDHSHNPSPETSGSGFILFGLAWGVNRGLLDEAEYGPAIDRGWAALIATVEDSGKLGWVQQVGNAPDEVRREDTQFYGGGAFLLAASEVLGRY
jgi:rhamnogalacturonyl hydrolase YesR